VEWEKLAMDVLQNKEITKRDFMCTMLGDGTLQGAIATMGLAPLEIVDIADYSQWLRSRWGIVTHSRENEGVPVLHWRTLPKLQRDYVKALCEQDRLLYNLFQRVRATKTTLSVEGRDLWYDSQSSRSACSQCSDG
jgi:hypothetical protein